MGQCYRKPKHRVGLISPCRHYFELNKPFGDPARTLSFLSVRQFRYGFGWESQLLETAFLAAFAVPMLSLQPFPPSCPPPAVIPWLYRWLGFRIMFGAYNLSTRGTDAINAQIAQIMVTGLQRLYHFPRGWCTGYDTNDLYVLPQ